MTANPGPAPAGVARRRLRVTGTVQGVGFRPFVYRLATELGLAGVVSNDSLGVVVDLEGSRVGLEAFGRRLTAEAPPLARVERVEAEEASPTGEQGFSIVDSRAAGAPAVAVSVDVATCEDCRRELADPADRRYRYPFVNCTNCGPRYTIIRAIPYDRPATTMASFPMCEDCRAEYRDPTDRRFHAEPVACWVCGPLLRYLSPDGEERARGEEAMAAAVADLAAGRIVAVKGLGGYHLATDATDDRAVAELRRRKQRDDKPFALMVADLDAARGLVRLGPAAAAELASPRRPILLAPRTGGAEVPQAVAPGLAELGVMLAYTPVHDLLLAGVGRPLVMTSGNLSDEPIAHDDDDATRRLGPLVDGLLTHDRDIHIRCDDSVVRATPWGPGAGPGDGTQMVRRSRGYAPEPIRLARPTPCHLLAVGAELKNTVAVAKGRNVIASHHIGDLSHLAAYQAFLQAVDHLCDLTGVAPALVAHDEHPEYLSTKFALDGDVPVLGVQHHHAHVASCLVEHGYAAGQAVLGIAFDGLGLGPDGTIWGGELLVADLGGYERVGHLWPVPLVGGDLAQREPWRMALVWLDAALGTGAAQAYGEATDERWSAVLDRAHRPDALLTTSAGRLFDAVAAVVGLHAAITYEGQAAIALEARAAAVAPHDAPRWAVDLHDDGERVVVDPRPLVARIVAERDRGTPLAALAAGFHASLGEAVAEAGATLARRHGLATAALSGGVFQNVRLTETVARGLAARGLDVLLHRHLPPNDGGIAVGQAAVAAAWADRAR